ncbi:unnamed protein product [Bathycoccus prasinos]
MAPKKSKVKKPKVKKRVTQPAKSIIERTICSHPMLKRVQKEVAEVRGEFAGEEKLTTAKVAMRKGIRTTSTNEEKEKKTKTRPRGKDAIWKLFLLLLACALCCAKTAQAEEAETQLEEPVKPPPGLGGIQRGQCRTEYADGVFNVRTCGKRGRELQINTHLVRTEANFEFWRDVQCREKLFVGNENGKIIEVGESLDTIFKRITTLETSSKAQSTTTASNLETLNAQLTKVSSLETSNTQLTTKVSSLETTNTQLNTKVTDVIALVSALTTRVDNLTPPPSPPNPPPPNPPPPNPPPPNPPPPNPPPPNPPPPNPPPPNPPPPNPPSPNPPPPNPPPPNPPPPNPPPPNPPPPNPPPPNPPPPNPPSPNPPPPNPPPPNPPPPNPPPPNPPPPNPPPPNPPPPNPPSPNPPPPNPPSPNPPPPNPPPPDLDYSYLGEGECRQSDGTYPIKFSKGYTDLRPHTSGLNAHNAIVRCKAKCIVFAWCSAAEVVLRDIWPTPECRLVTDWNAYVVESTNTFQNNQWGGMQSIDGENYQTYCNGGSSPCSSSNVFDGGKLYSRDGYHCYLKTASA